MSAAACLEKAIASGVKLYVEAGRLRGRGARPEPDLAATLREHEAEIVALLASRESAAQPARPSRAPVTPAPTDGPWPEPKIIGSPPFGVDHVPSRYEAGWQNLLASCPSWAAPWQWDVAIFSCRDLFGEWGAELLRLDWKPEDLFDRWHGLAWFLRGQHVTAIGARRAFLEDGRIFERTGR
jgi:hypothetical protein